MHSNRGSGKPPRGVRFRGPTGDDGMHDDPVIRAGVAEVARLDGVIARAQAERVRALAGVGARVLAAHSGDRADVREHEMGLRSVSAEIGARTHTSDRTIQREIDAAMTLASDYPTTLAAWEHGEITRGHVRAVTDAGIDLPHEARRDFDAEAAEHCRTTTPGRARAALERAAQRLHPRTLEDRHADAMRRRCVRVIPGTDGMSDVVATVSSVIADAIHDRLTRQANAVVDVRREAASGAGADGAVGVAVGDAAGGADDARAIVASDARAMDEVRADVFADMLLTGAPEADPTAAGDGPGTLGAIRARVQIVVPALTLLRRSRTPAEIVGRGPVDADTAARLARATPVPWERVITHPVTGEVLATDGYARTTGIDRHLRARDQHCRFPGCRIPAIRCEVDHTTDFALGGRTEVSNLAHLCQRHHSMKQFTAWRVAQRAGGVLEWTSPLGVTHIERPSLITEPPSPPDAGPWDAGPPDAGPPTSPWSPPPPPSPSAPPPAF